MREVKLMLTTVALIAFLTVASPKAQTAFNEPAIKEVAEKFFRAFEKQDIDEMMSYWSRRSPQFDWFKQMTQEGFAYSSNVQVSNITFTRWKEASNQVDVYVRFEQKGHEKFLRQTIDRKTVWAVQFVNENGSWKWFQMKNTIPELGMKLRLANTKEERMQLLEKERDILTEGVGGYFLSQSMNYVDQRNFSEALKMIDVAFEIATFLNDQRMVASCYAYRGRVSLSNRNYQEAVSHFERAASLFRESGDSYGQVQALNDIGDAYRMLGDYSESLRRLELARQLAHEKGDDAGEAAALNTKGIIHRSKGEYTDALADYEASFKISQKIDDQRAQARALNNLGEVYWLIGDYKEALANLGNSLDIAREIDDGEIELNALHNTALVYRSTGRLVEAMKQLETVVRLAESFGSAEIQARALNNLGAVYVAMGRYSDASGKYERSLEIAKRIGDATTQAMLLANKGGIYALNGKYEQAIQMCEEALQMLNQNGLKQGEIGILQTIGLIYALEEDNPRALEYLKSALEAARKTASKAAEASTLTHLGFIYVAEEKFDAAVQSLQAALKISDSLGDPIIVFRAYQGLGHAYRKQKKVDTAIGFYKTAIERIEQLREQATDPLLQADLFGTYTLGTSPYYGLVRSLLELRADADEAFAISERARARTLIGIIKAGGIGLIEGLTEQEKYKEQLLASKIIRIETELNDARSTPDSTKRVDALKRQLEDARVNYGVYRRDLFISHPELRVRNVQFDPATLAQISRELFSLAPDTCLLSYLIDDDEVTLLVIYRGVSPQVQPKLTYYTLKTEKGEDLTRKQLEQHLQNLRLRCMNQSGAYKPFAHTLYKLLIAPAEKDLTDKSHIIIIPDGVLHTLPFQVLMDGQGKHLIERYRISYAPSATALLEMIKLADRRQKEHLNSRPIFVMGRRTFPDDADHRDGELFWAEDQAKSIADLYGVKPFIGLDATKATALAEMGKARYVHLATHGDLNEASPMYSAIVLGKGKDDDGMLYARDLLDMHLQAELVTLSACKTALGQQVNGEGILGLTWALFVAGTPSSVVTQWSVRDDSMNQLMLEFYRQLHDSEAKGGKVSKAEALRRAQLSLMNDPRYKHPYYWAPTVLIGDWR